MNTRSDTRILRLGAVELRRSPREPGLVVVLGDLPGQVLAIPAGTSALGRGDDCAMQLPDAGLSRRHLEFERAADEAGNGPVRVRDPGSTNGSLLNMAALGREPRVLREGDELQLGPALRLRFGRFDPQALARARIRDEAAHQDALTGLANRRSFDDALAARLAADDWALVLIDLDHFKAVNDMYGHPAGDAVLVEIALRLRQAAGPADLTARLGGEEFVWLCTAAHPAAARERAEALRARIAGAPVRCGLRRIAVTASLGVAHRRECTGSPAEILDLADRRLYAAKHGGRNRVC